MPSRTVSTMAVSEADRQQVVAELGRQGGGRPLAQPAAQAVLSALEPVGVGRTVLAQEEAGSGGQTQEVVVEGGRDRGLLGQDERRGAANGREVVVVEGDQRLQLAQEPLDVGGR